MIWSGGRYPLLWSTITTVNEKWLGPDLSGQNRVQRFEPSDRPCYAIGYAKAMKGESSQDGRSKRVIRQRGKVIFVLKIV